MNAECGVRNETISECRFWIADLKEDEKRSEVPSLKCKIGVNDESGRDEAKDETICFKNNVELESLMKEADELLAITVSSIKTARRKKDK